MLPPKTKLSIPIFVPRCDHAPIPSRNDLSRVERKARHISVGFPDPLPGAVPTYFAADCASRVLNQRKRVLLGNHCEPGEITWHTHLMDTQDRPRGRSDGGFYT